MIIYKNSIVAFYCCTDLSRRILTSVAWYLLSFIIYIYQLKNDQWNVLRQTDLPFINIFKSLKKSEYVYKVYETQVMRHNPD